MYIIHECFDAFEGTVLRVYVDFENFWLKLTYDEESDNARREAFQFESLEALQEGYDKKVGQLFDEDNDEHEYRDLNNNPAEIINLVEWYELYKDDPACRCVPDTATTLAIPPREALTGLARQTVSRVLLSRKNKDAEVRNLVFYWNGESCCVYMNSSRLNDLGEPALEAYISGAGPEGWVDGELIEKDILTFQALDFNRWRDEFDEPLSNKALCDEIMYRLCALLEQKKLVGNRPIAADFKAFSIWRDDKTVNFERRREIAREFIGEK